MSGAEARGRFVWYELMTSDSDAAIDFYSKVIGWGTAVWEGGTTPYTVWLNGETPVGGVMPLPEEVKAVGAPPHWMAYIATPDVDATVKQASELGGTVYHPPTDIPNEGRFAVLADPQGAVFAALTPAGEVPGHEGPPQQGEFSWHELSTTDYEAALDFYQTLFGWDKAEANDMGELGIYQVFGRKGISLGGIYNKPPEMPAPPMWLYYTMVDDVHRVVEKVKQHGGQVLNGPTEVPGGDWVAVCWDPQGAVFAIHSTKHGT